MSKKQKLIIPPELLRWVRKELRERNGEISDMWDEGLPWQWLINISNPEPPTTPSVINTENFTIFSDLYLSNYDDIFVRLYWTGDGFDQESDSSMDFSKMTYADAEKEVAIITSRFPNIKVSILRITSSTKTEEISVN